MVTDNQISAVDPLELMARAKNGNREAFGRLYQEYLRPVYRYALIRLRDEALAEDITQTVFIKVYESLHRWQPRHSSPLAFFFTVARNTIIDHWKKKKDLPLDSALEIPDKANHLQELTDSRLGADYIHSILRNLSPEHQEIINLKFISGLSNEEISIILKKSQAAVRQLQCRALRALREQANSN